MTAIVADLPATAPELTPEQIQGCAVTAECYREAGMTSYWLTGHAWLLPEGEDPLFSAIAAQMSAMERADASRLVPAPL